MTPIEVYRELISKYNSGIFECYDGLTLKRCYENNEIPPDHCLPGRVVMNMSKDKRDILKKLSSTEVEKERLF